MAIKEYNKISEKLFEDWIHKYPNEFFIRDGIVNVDEWFKPESKKICFLLKEAYTSEENWRLDKWLNEDVTCIKNTWITVPLWLDGILKTTETAIPAFTESNKLDKQSRHRLLQKIAVVNVKKASGEKTSDWYNLAECANRDQTELKKQLEIINPDVIVCGSTYDFLRIVYGATYDTEKKRIKEDGEIPSDITDKGFFIMNDKTIVIKYYHPQNHFPAKVNYYAVCAIYQQALKELNSKNTF